MTQISPLAVVDSAAQIGSEVRIGPFCVIGPEVVIGDKCTLMNNVTIEGQTHIGKNNFFYPNVVVGAAPQDLKYDGAPTRTEIGDNNVFRENITIHRGTELGGGLTRIGSGCLIMVGAHIAHDCLLEDAIILGNQVLLAGHVKIERGAVISAIVGIHHFVTVGKYSYVAAMTPVRRDVPPFLKFEGDPNEVRGVNEEGLKRNGFSADDIKEIKDAYKKLYRQGNSIAVNVEQLLAGGNLNEHVAYLCDFIRRSCASRFGRDQESSRRDGLINRRGRKPAEVRNKKS